MTNSLSLPVALHIKQIQSDITNAEPRKCDGFDFFPLLNLPHNVVEYDHSGINAVQLGIKYVEHGWRNSNKTFL